MVERAERQCPSSQVVVQSLKKAGGDLFEDFKAGLVELIRTLFHLLPAFTQALLHLDHVVGCDDRATRNRRDYVDMLHDPEFFEPTNHSWMED